MKIPDNSLYTKTHEWLVVDGRVATVGLTHVICDAVGDITHIDLASVGSRVQQGGVVGVLEAAKAVTDIFSPISGEIIAVNPILAGQPSRISRKPYDEGWLFKASLAAPPAGLLSAAEYNKLLASLKDTTRG